MSEQILTDDEKGALLEGMSSGEVEVCSKHGSQYAEVKPFEIGPRSRIVSNSFPRLRQFDLQLAGRINKFADQFLNTETTIKAKPVETCTYSEFCGRIDGLFLVIEFSAEPLSGPGLIFMDAALIGHMVESFYGSTLSSQDRRNPDFFTPGETTVASLFGDGFLATIKDVWASIVEIEPQRTSIHMSSNVIDTVDGSDTVICTEFDISLSDNEEVFQVVWPASTVVSMLPVFEGKKRERDPEEDARWERALRSSVADSVVRISSNVGQTELTLGEVAEMTPGDVIGISNPRVSTVIAEHVPLIEGRFGVHEGNYAVEAVRWLEPAIRH